tara:strand:+ start:4333 stop:5127 length:795 start_codon:yes stop_codon:yes gene_type:complete
MSVLECLKQGFNKLKQDTILFGPYLAFTLFNIKYSRHFLTLGETFSTNYMVYLLGQHVLQSLVGFFLIIMLLNLRNDEVYIPLAFSLFSNRLSKYLGMSIIVNIPFSIVLYLGMSMANMDSQAMSGAAVILLGIGIYVMVPLTAFGYFACIRYVLSKKPMMVVFTETLLCCFKQYRISLRWFWMMLTLNMLQIFVFPLTVTNFILKDVLLAMVQSFILTLIMSFSVLYYKQFVSPLFREERAETITSSDLDTTGVDNDVDGNES